MTNEELLAENKKLKERIAFLEDIMYNETLEDVYDDFDSNNSFGYED